MKGSNNSSNSTLSIKDSSGTANKNIITIITPTTIPLDSTSASKINPEILSRIEEEEIQSPDITATSKGNNSYKRKKTTRVNTNNFDFDLKVKRLGFNLPSEQQNQEMIQSTRNKSNLDGYVQDLQPKLNGAFEDLKNYLDRRYQLLVSQLSKVGEKLRVKSEELRNLEAKIDRDSEIMEIAKQLQDYKVFAKDLKEDINAFKTAIQQQEKQTLGLYSVYQGKKEQLHAQNRRNLEVSHSIVQIQSILEGMKEIKEGSSYFNNQSMESENNNNNTILNGITKEKNIPTSSIGYGNNNNNSTSMTAVNKPKPKVHETIIARDPLSKIEAYCGTYKQVSSSLRYSQNYSKLPDSLIDDASLLSQRQALSMLHQKSFISNKSTKNFNTFQSQSQEMHKKHATASSLSPSSRYKAAGKQYKEGLNTQEVVDHWSSEGQDTKDFRELNRNIEIKRAQNSNLKNKLITNCNVFFQLYELYSDCMAAERKSVESSQKKVLKDSGLLGSLHFEMQKAQLFLTENDLQLKMTQAKNKTALQDREIRFVVHATLQNMVDTKFQKYKKEYQKDDFMLDWAAFKDISPAQIIGLMSLKPQVFQTSTKTFENKARLIKDKIKMNKTLAGVI